MESGFFIYIYIFALQRSMNYEEVTVFIFFISDGGHRMHEG